MFDAFRDKDDVIRDIKSLYEIVQEYENNKDCLRAAIMQCDIKEIVPCPENHQQGEVAKLLNCPICKGTKLQVIKYKEGEQRPWVQK